MSPVEMREHPAVAGNPASKGIKDLLEEEATVVAAVMATAVEAADTGAAAVEIEAAGKGADEELQWRIKCLL